MVYVEPSFAWSKSWQPYYRKKCTQPANRALVEGCVLRLYIPVLLFYYMENCGILDPADEVHLFALHYVYVPRLQRNLDLFTVGHNRGPLSTEHNASPEQLFIQGMLLVAGSERRTSIEFANQVKLFLFVTFHNISFSKNSLLCLEIIGTNNRYFVFVVVLV